MSMNAVLTLLGDLPPGANPYTALRQTLQAKVVPIAPNSYRIQLYIFLAILSL